jgi:glycosyltransferase involved in cell wall biosynthesis
MFKKCVISIEEFSESSLQTLVRSKLICSEYRVRLLHDHFDHKSKLMRDLLKNATTVEVPSDYMKKIALNSGAIEERISLERPGFKTLMNEKGKGAARSELKISGKVLVSIGELEEWNNFIFLISCMPELLKRFPFLSLVILGQGSKAKEIVEKIKSLGLQKKIKLIETNSQEVISTYLEASDIFVLPSLGAGLSESLLLAVNTKMPVVTTGEGGNSEMLTSYENVVFVNPENRRDIMKTIEKILLR